MSRVNTNPLWYSVQETEGKTVDFTMHRKQDTAQTANERKARSFQRANKSTCLFYASINLILVFTNPSSTATVVTKFEVRQV